MLEKKFTMLDVTVRCICGADLEHQVEWGKVDDDIVGKVIVCLCENCLRRESNKELVDAHKETAA